MDIVSAQGLLAMLQIIVIDILLAGDNAIVIGMAARNLPADLQKKAIFWGTAGGDYPASRHGISLCGGLKQYSRTSFSRWYSLIVDRL